MENLTLKFMDIKKFLEIIERILGFTWKDFKQFIVEMIKKIFGFTRQDLIEYIFTLFIGFIILYIYVYLYS